MKKFSNLWKTEKRQWKRFLFVNAEKSENLFAILL